MRGRHESSVPASRVGDPNKRNCKLDELSQYTKSLEGAKCYIPALPILIITHKFLEPPVERDAKAEIMPCLFNATWLATVVCKNVPKDVGNDKPANP